MRKTTLLSSMLAALVLLPSCGGSLDFLGLVWTLSDNPDSRFEQSQTYNSSIKPITVEVPSEDYKVYVFTDQHTDETTHNLDRFVRNYLEDSDAAPFCLCLGDVIDGMEHYPLFCDHIAPITGSPTHMYFPALGNHDIFYDQWNIWKGYFKTSSYHFDVLLPSGAKDFFLCLDSASGTLGNKQFKWVTETLESASDAGYRYITVFTHTNIFKKDSSQGHTSNYELEETYELIKLFSSTGVDLVLMGHDHNREHTLFGGVEYEVIDSLEDTSDNPCYATVIFGEERIALEHISLAGV